MKKKRRMKVEAGSGNIFADLGLPDLSNLLRGRFRGYSAERLMRMLTAFGQDVEITVHPRRRKHGECGRITFGAAPV